MASSDSNHAGKDVQISLTLNVDPDLELTEGAPQSWELKLANGAELLIGGTENLRGQVKGHHHGKEQEDLITLRLSPEWSAGAAVEGQLVLKLFVCCKSDGCCMQKVLRKEFRLDPQTTNPSTKDNIPIFAYIVECELTK